MNIYDYDFIFMKMALEEAIIAYEKGEVPVGSVLVMDGRVISTGYNMREMTKDPTAHAEIITLRNAKDNFNSWRLCGTTIYVTKEPCIMCAGAIINSRVKRLVYGCSDPKAGAVDSLYNILGDIRLNHRVDVVSGILSEESAELLRRFFKERRISL